MRKSTIIEDLQDMLSQELPKVFIDRDWGQLDMEQPPVGWPCILIDIEEVQPRPLTDGNERNKATVVMKVANKRTNSSSAHAPRVSKEKSMETLNLSDDIHGFVQGYAADGAEYSKLQEVSFYKLENLPGIEGYAMRYTTSYSFIKETPTIQTPQDENT